MRGCTCPTSDLIIERLSTVIIMSLAWRQLLRREPPSQQASSLWWASAGQSREFESAREGAAKYLSHLTSCQTPANTAALRHLAMPHRYQETQI